MISIRHIWNHAPLTTLGNAESSLLTIENRIIESTEIYIDIAKKYSGEEYVTELSSLARSARNDLVGGCEMARAGYIKQAYSLWRSWFEQSIFFLYFLEAPIHKAAWQVKQEVTSEDSPQYRLMLHQLLNTSGEKHPFALVYESRHKRILEELKISGASKSGQITLKASRILTTLSQGVHGTYQPQVARDLAMIHTQLEKNCEPILRDAEKIFHLLWILFIVDTFAISGDILIKFREGTPSSDTIDAISLDEAPLLAKIAPFFSMTFPHTTK